MLSEIALSQKIMYGLSLYPFLLGGFGEGERGGAGFGEEEGGEKKRERMGN